MVTRFLSHLQLISKASKETANAGLRVLDLACGKGGDLGKWAAHPDGVEKYVGSDIAFGSLEHLVERMASESPRVDTFESSPESWRTSGNDLRPSAWGQAPDIYLSVFLIRQSQWRKVAESTGGRFL